MEELTPRQQRILALVVRTYVDTATPVSSKTLQELGDLGVSGATIRNEMAALEEAGYLTHPHTSAGRVPTDKGYRYFVEHLLDDELTPTERNTIRHQFHQARLEVAHWMQLAAAVMAHAARGAAVVTAPRLEVPRLRHLELISTYSHLVLLVLVLQGGIVRQRMLTLGEPISQSDLSQIASHINTRFFNADAATLRAHLHECSGFELDVLNLVLDLITDSREVTSPSEIYRDGLTEVLQEPEFSHSPDATALVNALEQPEFLREITTVPIGAVQVVIGGEGRWRELSSCSVVLARYGVEGFASGALGVLGPTRMPYGRAVSTVRFVADLMSELVNDLYVE